MTCERVKLPGGGSAIVCARRRRGGVRKCEVAGCTERADYQCDAPVISKKSGICDRYLCRTHRVPQRGRNSGVDFCLEHAEAAAERFRQQLSLALEGGDYGG